MKMIFNIDKTIPPGREGVNRKGGGPAAGPRGRGERRRAPAPFGAGARDPERGPRQDSLNMTVTVRKTFTGFPFFVAGL